MPRKIKLPAITVEVPRMGMIVYVSPRTGVEQKKHTAMFTAEIIVNKVIELQSFHLKCKDEAEAARTRDSMLKRLEKGPYPFIQTGI